MKKKYASKWAKQDWGIHILGPRLGRSSSQILPVESIVIINLLSRDIGIICVVF